MTSDELALGARVLGVPSGWIVGYELDGHVHSWFLADGLSRTWTALAVEQAPTVEPEVELEVNVVEVVRPVGRRGRKAGA